MLIGCVAQATAHLIHPQPGLQMDSDDSSAAPEMQAVTGRVKWFDATRGFGFLVCDDLDGDFSPESRVPRAVHLTHAAGAEWFEDLVGTKPRSWCHVRIISFGPARFSASECDYAGAFCDHCLRVC